VERERGGRVWAESEEKEEKNEKENQGAQQKEKEN